METDLARARELLTKAKHVVALTGAGISAESGVPTFRGKGGLWKRFRAEELANPGAFSRNPRLVWEWYDWRRQKLSHAKPNPAHQALVELEKSGKTFTLVTQNVDGLHELAGSKEPLEIHGNIWRLRCTGCGAQRVDRAVPLPRLPPHCECGGLQRPDVVFFGEMLPEGAIEQAARQVAECDVLLVVGTSGVVYPAAGLVDVALSCGNSVIEINPEQTGLSTRVTISLCGKAGELLPRIVNP